MNLKQTLFLKAIEAAKNVPADLSDHALATAQLAEFNSQGNDPLDFSDWSQTFSDTRSKLAQRAAQAAPSEIAAKQKARVAATAPGPTSTPAS